MFWALRDPWWEGPGQKGSLVMGVTYKRRVWIAVMGGIWGHWVNLCSTFGFTITCGPVLLSASVALLFLVGYSLIPRSNTRGSLSFTPAPFPSVPMHLLSSPSLYLFPCLLSQSFQHSTSPHPISLICSFPSIFLLLSSATNLRV